jgi:hypothetical protein
MVVVSQEWLIANERLANRPRPVVRPQRIGSSTRAWARWRAFSQGAGRCGCRWRGGVAVAVAFFGGVERGAGVGSFPAHDHPGAGRVVGWGQAGDLGDGGLDHDDPYRDTERRPERRPSCGSARQGTGIGLEADPEMLGATDRLTDGTVAKHDDDYQLRRSGQDEQGR